MENFLSKLEHNLQEIGQRLDNFFYENKGTYLRNIGELYLNKGTLFKRIGK